MEQDMKISQVLKLWTLSGFSVIYEDELGHPDDDKSSIPKIRIAYADYPSRVTKPTS